MKYILLLLVISSPFQSWGQDLKNYEKPPVYEGCKNESIDRLNICFTFQLQKFIFQNFELPSSFVAASDANNIKVLFEVDQSGFIKIIHVDALTQELKDETLRVFAALPQIEAGTINGKPSFFQYALTIDLPLVNPKAESLVAVEKQDLITFKDLNPAVTEFDDINKSLEPYSGREFKSQVNIPFTHQYYSRFDSDLNAVGTNSHTASKPYVFEEVANYYDFSAENRKMEKPSDTWVGRKLWNEHLVQIQSPDYWFTIDPVLDLQVGKDTEATFSSTYNNTRGVYIQGGLGKDFGFSASVFESQGRFPEYYNAYAESLKAFGPDPAIVPGRGVAKRFKKDSYDYPVAEAYLSYAPAKFVNVQFGHGKNFIGDGYRSLFQSDVASPQTFLKLNTKFWKIKYTNTWMWLRDVRDAVVEDKAFLTKYMANHYLSWNVSKRLNVGLFESVMWTNTNGRGFDINYLNPIIIFRAIEFESGQGSGNAVVGASAKYKISNKVNLYSQFVLDEFSLSDVKAQNKSWKNKFGYQLGVKYFEAFNVENLMLQLEYNQVRPYTYSHNTIVNNYAHSNQPMAHLWGANFREFIIIGHYQYERWFADAKLIFGTRGLDFNDGTDNYSYGGDLYRNYNDRPFDSGVKIGQGNKTQTINAELYLGYVINPLSHLKVFTNVSYRDFSPEATTATAFPNTTLWFNLGLRTDLFNWYYDN